MNELFRIALRNFLTVSAATPQTLKYLVLLESFWAGDDISAAAWLPAVSLAVSRPDSPIMELSQFPLPSQLPSEAVPWHEQLVSHWQQWLQATARTNWHGMAPALQVLVSLDACSPPPGESRPSLLPDFFNQAQQIRSQCEPTMEKPSWESIAGYPALHSYLSCLTALASWRPSSGVIFSPKTLAEWITFWRQMLKAPSPLVSGIAAKALLGCDSARNPDSLVEKISVALPVAVKASSDYDFVSLLFPFPFRSKLPDNFLVRLRKIYSAEDNWPVADFGIIRQIVLLQSSVPGHWLPNLYDGHATDLVHPEFSVFFALRPLRTLPASTLAKIGNCWSKGRKQQAENWDLDRLSPSVVAWLGSIQWRRAGLVWEPEDSFLEDYLWAVENTTRDDELSVLAQWSPAGDAPKETRRAWERVWERQPENERDREVAVFAFFLGARNALRH